VQNLLTIQRNVRDLDLKNCIDQIQQQIPIEAISATSAFERNDMLDPSFKKQDLQALVKLNARIVKCLLQIQRAESAYEQALENVFYSEDLLANQTSAEWKVISPLRRQRDGQQGHYLDIWDWVWETKLRPKCFLLCGIIASLLSTAILVGELAILFKAESNIFRALVRTDLGFFSANVSLCSL
jgi:hypothetical protein